MGNGESKPHHKTDKDATTQQSPNKDAASQQSQNKDSVYLQLQNNDLVHLELQDSVSLQLQNEDAVSLQLQNNDSVPLQLQDSVSLQLQDSVPLQLQDSVSLQLQNNDSVSLQSQNGDSIFLRLQDSDCMSFHLKKKDYVSLQVQNEDFESPLSDKRYSISHQLDPATRKGNEHRFFSPLNDVHTYGQRLTSVKSSITQVMSNITKNGSTNNVHGNIWPECNEATIKYPVTREQAEVGSSSHSHDILTFSETLASNWHPFRKTNPTKHTTEKMEDGNVFRNNISEDLYKVANTYLWAHEQAKLCSSKQLSNPTYTRANDDDQKTASLADRQVRPRPRYSKETTQQRQHWPVKDGMKYTCEKHKTAARPAKPHYSDCEEKSVTNLDCKLRWTQESERKVKINQANILSNMSSLNRTDEAKLNDVEMQASNSQIFKEVMFSNCASSIDLKPSLPLLSDTVVSEDNLSLSLSAGEAMYSAQRKYALKSKEDSKFSLRLHYLDYESRKYFEFERYYNYKACRKILRGRNGKLQYDAHIARCLISDLINFNDFQADLGTLSTKQDKDMNELIPLLKDNAGIFSLIVHSPTKTTVRLRPKIRYCSDRVSAECENIFCFAVHVCPYYIYDTCRVKNCKFGHALRTTKSNYIFKSFYLDSFSEYVLKGILRKIWAGTIYPKLCLAYNTGTCTAFICMDLHLCYKHVMSLGLCPGVHTYCPFNHDIYDPCCVKVFKHFNISTNETPRDLMKYVMYTTKSLLTLPYYCEATERNSSDFKLRNLFETLV